MAGWARLGRIRRGYGLPVILLFTILLLTVTLSDTYRVQHELSSRSRREKALRAEYAARAGLQRALSELSRDPDWAPATFTGTLEHDTTLSFDVEVLNNYRSPLETTAPDGSTLPPGRVWLESTGLVEGVPMRGGVGQAKAVPIRPLPIFNCAVDEVCILWFGRLPTYTNSLVDSYPGGLPASYVPYLVPGNPATYRRRTLVHSYEQVMVVDSGFLDATVVSPDSARLASVDLSLISGNVEANASWGPSWKFRLPSDLESLPVSGPVGAGSLAPGRYSSLDVPAGGVVELESGKYAFGTIVLGNGSQLTLAPTVSEAAPCELYLGVSATFGSNSRVNMTHPPRHLQIYSTDQGPLEDTYLLCDADSKLSATIAGYGMRVEFTDRVELFGAMKVYDFAEGAESRIHYDESLNGAILDGDPEWTLMGESSS